VAGKRGFHLLGISLPLVLALLETDLALELAEQLPYFGLEVSFMLGGLA